MKILFTFIFLFVALLTLANAEEISYATEANIHYYEAAINEARFEVDGRLGRT